MGSAVGIDRRVRNTSGAVTPDAAATEALYAKHKVPGKGPACACSNAAAVLGGIVSSHRRGHANGLSTAGSGRRDFAAREDAVAEAVEESEYFIVPDAGIESDLGDDVGR